NVEVFVRFYRMLLSVGGSVLFLIFLFSLIVIVNLIRISIQSRKEEIHVISLMGATERFIRLPILAEGFFEGFFAGLSAFILSLVVFRFLLEFLQVTFPFFFWISLKEAVIPFMVVNIVLGGMVGVLGSLIACNSILKEILK
ncbi:MAG: hypothetical protein NTX88_06685, partial [Candidatus Atribacteria bacterium]|nr:hypothetical protein [Candidatus Atribacteria bacterium]